MKKTLLIAAIFGWALTGGQAQRTSSETDYNRKVLTHYNVNVRNLAGINTPQMEFSPMFYQNGLVFVSSRQKFGPVDPKTGETYYDLYFSELDPNGQPGKPRGFSLELNSPLHEGPVTFNQKQDRIYFTRSNQSAPGVSRTDEKGRIWLKVYEAQRGQYDWENIRELSFNSDNYSCLHPTLTPDGTRMFFSSSMPGGYGGRDIYMSEKKGDTWSKPVNLGPEINTEKDEVFPFFHESGVLFFASDGHPGYGGMDVFMIDLSARVWGDVTNLGAPFNSDKDDFGLILDGPGKRGYFSSERSGGMGKADMYMFDAPDGLEGLSVTPKTATRVVVTHAENSRPIADAAVRAFEWSGEGSPLQNRALAPSPDDPSRLVFAETTKKASELEGPRQLTDRYGETLLQLEDRKAYSIVVSKPGFVTQELRYTVNGGGIPLPIEVTLQEENCLGLTGITFNSNDRRLIANARVRIINECHNSEETVLTNVEGKFSYCLEIGCDYTIISQIKGYTQGRSEISTVKIRGSRSVEIELPMTPTSTEIISSGPIRQGSVIVLENIYYDFDKWDISAGAAAELEALAQLMKKYPSMEIELIAHTDSRGDNNHNLMLSLKRAEAAKAFLVKRGIKTGRIRAFGYGESKLRNHCADGVECTEEEHRYNRRTEIIVTRIDEPIGLDFGGKQKNGER